MGDLWGRSSGGSTTRATGRTATALVTHGLLMRFFCMHYLGWTEHEFEQARSSPSALEPS